MVWKAVSVVVCTVVELAEWLGTLPTRAAACHLCKLVVVVEVVVVVFCEHGNNGGVEFIGKVPDHPPKPKPHTHDTNDSGARHLFTRIRSNYVRIWPRNRPESTPPCSGG